MEESESVSWWLDARNRPPNHSPWLQAILSDLDKKIKTIVNLIEDGGDSFTERVGLFYKRTPGLLSILRELHLSYQNLASSYDKIRSSETAKVAQFRSPFSSLRSQQMPLNRVKTEDLVTEGIENEEKENLWEDVKPRVSKLMEDNLRHQMELIRRNDEKREMIKQLQGQICRLMEENRALKSFIAGYRLEFKHTDSNSSNSKFKGLNCLGSFHGPN